MTFRNYTLVYKHGYERSEQECIYCDHIHGPFVAKTKLFKMVGYVLNCSLSKFWFQNFNGVYVIRFCHLPPISFSDLSNVNKACPKMSSSKI